MGFVAAVAKFLALLIAGAAAIAAALIVLPSLHMKMALAAIVASEKSALIAAAAVVSLPLAFFGFTRGRRAPVGARGRAGRRRRRDVHPAAGAGAQPGEGARRVAGHRPLPAGARSTPKAPAIRARPSTTRP